MVGRAAGDDAGIGAVAARSIERLSGWLDPLISVEQAQELAAFAALASVAVSLLAYALLVVQIRGLTRQTRFEQQVNRAEMFLHLSEKWSDILPHRYEVMSARTLATKEAVAKRYKSPTTFMKTAFWTDLREVLNFYEILGLMIHQKYVSAEEAFVLVSVDFFDKDDPDNGKFYTKVRPYLEYLRENYREDIYVFYDRGLLPIYLAHRRAQFEPVPPLLARGWLTGRISHALRRFRRLDASLQMARKDRDGNALKLRLNPPSDGR